MNEPAHMADMAVIIVNWNTRDLLRRCLDSVSPNSTTLRLQVIVVDNGSRDGSQDMLQQDYLWVELVQNTTNVGFARANNQGAELANAPLLLLLNSDAAVLPGALTAAAEYMDEHREVGIAGLQLLNDDRTLQAPGERFPSLFSTIISLSPLPQQWRANYEQRRSTRDYSKIAFVDTVYGAAMLIRYDLFRDLHGLDDRFFFTSEETDFCWRARERGVEIVYLPIAQAIHSGGGAVKKLPSIRHGLLTQRGRYLLIRLHKPTWQVLLLKLYLTPFTAARCCISMYRLVRNPTLAHHVTLHLYLTELLWLLRN